MKLSVGKVLFSVIYILETSRGFFEEVYLYLPGRRMQKERPVFAELIKFFVKQAEVRQKASFRVSSDVAHRRLIITFSSCAVMRRNLDGGIELLPTAGYVA